MMRKCSSSEASGSVRKRLTVDDCPLVREEVRLLDAQSVRMDRRTATHLFVNMVQDTGEEFCLDG